MTKFASLAIAGLILGSLSSAGASLAQPGTDPMSRFVLTTVSESVTPGAGHGLCPRIVGNEDGPVIQYQGARC